MGLQPIPARARYQRPKDGECLGDGIPVPQRSVLLFKGDDISDSVGASCGTCMLQQHQGKERAGFIVVGHQLNEQPGEPDCFTKKRNSYESLPAGSGVPLGEQQIQHRQHTVAPFRHEVGRWHTVGNTDVLDLCPGTHQSFVHRRLGHEKGTSDLRGCEARYRSQRRGNAIIHRKCGVAAGENETETIIHICVSVRIGLDRLVCFDGNPPKRAVFGARMPKQIDRAPLGYRGQPRARIVRDATFAPVSERPRKRILCTILGKGEVAGHPNHSGDDARSFLGRGTSDGIRYSIGHIGLISI